MAVDPLSPIAPSRVRVLLLPCGKITQSRFLTFVNRVQQDAVVIYLRDISPSGKPHRNMFSPLAFPSGAIFYDMTTSNPSQNYKALSPFELYREPLAIVAVADGAEHTKYWNYSNDATVGNGSRAENEWDLGKHFLDELEQSVAWLKEQYNSALAHRVFIFDCDATDKSLPAFLVPVPSLEKSNTTTMKTIICDLTTDILAEMDSYAKSLQALPNIETPRSTGSKDRLLSNDYSPESRISGTSGSRSSSPARGLQRHPSQGTVTSIPSNLLSENGTVRNPSVTFDQIGNTPIRPDAASDIEQGRPSSRDRVPVHGFGSGSVGERARNKAKGRMGIVLGSMYLHAGRWPDAVKELTESAAGARANNDHVWHAKALELILICLLLCAWTETDFEIPQVCHPMGEKTNPAVSRAKQSTPTGSQPDLSALKSPDATNRTTSLQNLSSLLPDLLNNILNLYVRAATFTADQLPQVAFSESTIRFAKLLAIVEGSHGVLDDRALQNIVLHTNNKPPKPSPLPLGSFPSKSDIATMLFRAIPSSLVEKSLELQERIGILTGVASVLARLNYHRKKAFILRELLALLLPALVQSRKDSAAELGVHPAASLSSLDLTSVDMGLDTPISRSDATNHGLQSFLLLICEVYGVVLLEPSTSSSLFGRQADKAEASLSLSSHEAYDFTSVISRRVVENARIRSFGNQLLKLDVLRSCINICEALPDLRGVLRFSGDLLCTAGSGIAPGPEDSEGSPALAIEDQLRLSNNVSRTVNAAKQLGLNHIEAEYWDEFLVRDIELVKPFSSNVPTVRGKGQLNMANFNGPEKPEGPFIYNPFVTKPGSVMTEPLLIAEEEAIFTILLQNLYDFDLEIEWIKLDCNDVSMETVARNIVVGPYRTLTVPVPGTPISVGLLRITGCIAKIRGCRPRRFSLFRAPWKAQDETKLKRLGLSNMGLPNEYTEPSSKGDKEPGQLSTTKAPVATDLVINIIEPQPNVVVNDTSLFQSAMMILEGETKMFIITLRNLSEKIPVDLLALSFSDSTSTSLQAAMSNKNLPPSEVYEAEMSAFQKLPFRLRQRVVRSENAISRNGEISFEIEVFGKPGLTHGAIHIDYGHLGIPKSDVKDHFYTRQLSFLFTITVNSSLDLIRNDLLPFSGDLAWLNNCAGKQLSGGSKNTSEDGETGQAFKAQPRSLLDRLGLGNSNNDQCLVLLDFQNAWPNPLSISVQVRNHVPLEPENTEIWDEGTYTACETVQPGHTARLVLLLPKLSLAHSHAPIPSLNPTKKRQFVLSASQMSPEVERANREMFWYREEALKHMRASWNEVSSGRTGEIDLRALRLTPRMVDALKLEEVGIELSLGTSFGASSSPTLASTSNTVRQLGRSRFHVPTDTFVAITVRITNRLSHPIHPLLRLVPSIRNQAYTIALDLAKKFAFNGLLQRTLPPIASGESRKVELGCLFLCAGEFEVAASLEEVRVWKPPVDELGDAKFKEEGRPRRETEDEGGILSVANGERRVWYASEGLLVDVVDVVDGAGDGNRKL